MPSISQKELNYQNVVGNYNSHHKAIDEEFKYIKGSVLELNNKAGKEVFTAKGCIEMSNESIKTINKLENQCKERIKVIKDYYEDSYIGRMQLLFSFIFEPKLGEIEADIARLSSARQQLEEVKKNCETTIAKYGKFEQSTKALFKQCEDFEKLPPQKRDIGRRFTLQTRLIDKKKELESNFKKSPLEEELKRVYTRLEKLPTATVEDQDLPKR